MTDENIAAALDTIERSISVETAIARFRAYGEVALYANKNGYLVLAAQMLRCALGRTSDADVSQLFTGESDFSIDHFASSEEQLDFFSK
ncbi:hypothetical protein [Massilia sp. CF038]|uniref:hypothetical protein n=1 Tax=Massilia sp. CF038 TaxID=1881045 RepID=UPI00091E9881|nr:hypothetical protein [Massilia sp. CF038]SHG63408.1 hypothetical protein SAMN05428948_1372 [Massilia sp. CF038]